MRNVRHRLDQRLSIVASPLNPDRDTRRRRPKSRSAGVGNGENTREVGYGNRPLALRSVPLDGILLPVARIRPDSSRHHHRHGVGHLQSSGSWGGCGRHERGDQHRDRARDQRRRPVHRTLPPGRDVQSGGRPYGLCDLPPNGDCPLICRHRPSACRVDDGARGGDRRRVG
jgi:hypothetical protein